VLIMIKSKAYFGKSQAIAVHQIYDERGDLENAVYNAERDNFDTIVLYVDSADVDTLVDDCNAIMPDCFVQVAQLRLIK
jgi:hypothetical protein